MKRKSTNLEVSEALYVPHWWAIWAETVGRGSRHYHLLQSLHHPWETKWPAQEVLAGRLEPEVSLMYEYHPQDLTHQPVLLVQVMRPAQPLPT